VTAVEEVDFLVIGSGPAGQKGAVQASKSGMKTVLIEGGELGGASLWSGTIPSKTLREAVLDLTRFRTKNFYGTQSNLPAKSEISVSDLIYRLEWVKKHLQETTLRQLKKNKIDIVHGWARFRDAHTVDVYRNEEKIRSFRAGKILLTPGSKPRALKGVIFDGKKIFDSTQLLEMDVIPKSLLVVGAGVIGSEYASIFSVLGSKVIMIDRKARILSFLDREIGSHLLLALEESKLSFHGNKDYESITVKGDEVVVQCKDGSVFTAEKALIASGRVANVEGLSLDVAGLSLNGRGYIEVDEYFRTSVAHIYAAGDVIGKASLSSTGYVEGRLAALHAFHEKVDPVAKLFPYGIYTIPEISYIGKNEEELQAEGVDYEVGRSYFYEVSRSVITGSESGLCKILFDRKKRDILGVHIVGRGATEVIHIAQVAISFNAKIDYFVEQVFNFPTFAEMYRIAALNGLNKLKKTGYIHGHI
jgi:NAD(P) transhydrogenase